ncbi:MAG TPA: hypothetical protein VJ864_01475, partial [Candidatus Binatia bacterium]|nr:hypothetical protein [Candidatus Binatia bacterium]
MLTIDCGFEGAPQAWRMLVLRGVVLSVNVGFDSNYKPESNTPPKAGVSRIEALVDTGSDESCIDNILAHTLGLPIVDRQRVTGIAGLSEVNMHLGQIYIPRLKFTVHGRLAAVKLVEGGS